MPRKPATPPPPQPPQPPQPPLSAAEPKTRTVRCPACGGPSLYGPANRWRPFCSERCKLQDLGAWASERFRVEVRETDGADVDPVMVGNQPDPRVH